MVEACSNLDRDIYDELSDTIDDEIRRRMNAMMADRMERALKECDEVPEEKQTAMQRLKYRAANLLKLVELEAPDVVLQAAVDNVARIRISDEI
jgi:hypothetical protein